jgi:hypothetical protein
VENVCKLLDFRETTWQALAVLSNMGTEAKQCAPRIVNALHEQATEQTSAIEAVEHIGPLDKQAILAILSFVRQSESLPKGGVRAAHLQYLAHVAAAGDKKLEILISWLGLTTVPVDLILQPSESHSSNISREEGEEILGVFDDAWKYVGSDSNLRGPLADSVAIVASRVPWDANNAVDLQALEGQVKQLKERSAHQVATVEDVVAKLRKQKFSPEVFKQYSWIFAILFCGVAILLIYWLKPLLLLRLNPSVLQRFCDALPDFVGGKVLKIAQPLVSAAVYRPRVLDAWVAKYAVVARERFLLKQTVLARAVHIPVPVVLNGSSVAALAPLDLSSAFARNVVRVRIVGEG